MALVTTDKGIPIPERWAGSQRRQKYPWDTMDVGDSFLVVSKSGVTMLLTTATRTRPGKKFVSRKVPDGHRIWRTA